MKEPIGEQTLSLLGDLTSKPFIHAGDISVEAADRTAAFWVTKPGWEKRLLSEEGRERENRFLIQNMDRLRESGAVFWGEFFGYYPWRYCDSNVSIAFPLVKKMLKEERGLDVKKPEIMKMVKRDLLPAPKNGGLPLFAVDRIVWLRSCESILGYSESQLRQLVEYEDQLIRHLSSDGVNYEECELLNARVGKKTGRSLIEPAQTMKHKKAGVKDLREWISVLRKLFRNHRQEHLVTFLQNAESVAEKLERVEELTHKAGKIAQSARQKAVLVREQTKKVREALEEAMANLRQVGEIWAIVGELAVRVWEVSYFRTMILGGCSPQISFVLPEEDPRGSLNIQSARVDWAQSLKNIDDLELDFVRTPAFTVEHDEGEIHIRVTKPEMVTTAEMRENVEKVYKRIRDKVVTGKRRWGTVSGSRDYYDERDKRLKEHFNKKIKASAPSKEAAFKQLTEWMLQQKYHLLTIGRLEKLVYGE